ncbi:MAG: linear amide C-N hydrolase [Nodosilinea sp.]
MKSILNRLTAVVFFSVLVAKTAPALACTGISLKSQDGGVVVARTVEWALGDAKHNQIAVFPRGRSYHAQTPEGNNGKAWTGKFGFVSVAAYDQPYGPDAMNEKGLYVGVYYFPGYASYHKFEPAKASNSMSVGDFMQWLLSSFQTVEEVKQNLRQVVVVNVEDPRFGGAPLPFHWKIADSTGASIVIEIVNGGEVKVYDTFRGIITNSPTYDWQLTNLRNYINLSTQQPKPLTIDNFTFSPFGGGAGLVGLPGDFTPPSRFVRAAALTATVRPLATSEDAVFEAFRILDSFSIPVGVTAPQGRTPQDIESATQITVASDLTNRRYYFHTMSNRGVRMINLAKINFATVKEQIIDGDAGQKHVVQEITLTN